MKKYVKPIADLIELKLSQDILATSGGGTGTGGGSGTGGGGGGTINDEKHKWSPIL